MLYYTHYDDCFERDGSYIHYFKPSQDPIGISHPGPSRQRGEAHDCDNEVTQGRGSESEEIEHSASTMGSEAGSRPSASKRARIDHYDSEWQRKYDWLTPVRGSSGAVVGMLCDLCKKHKTIARNGSSKWSIEPCTCLRVDAVTRHLKSSQHKTSMSKELVLQQSCGGGGIAFMLNSGTHEQIRCNQEAIMGAMRTLYFLVKHALLHTTLYGPLLDFCTLQGCDYLTIFLTCTLQVMLTIEVRE